MYELRAMFNEAVQMRLDTLREIYKEDIKGMLRICESHRNLESTMRDVVIEVGNQLVRNNDRNNQQEVTLKALGEAIIGLLGD